MKSAADQKHVVESHNTYHARLAADCLARPTCDGNYDNTTLEAKGKNRRSTT